MTKVVQPAIDKLLGRLFVSVDTLLDNEVVDETEVAAKLDLQRVLPELQSDWKNASTDLEAVKAKYAVQGGKSSAQV